MNAHFENGNECTFRKKAHSETHFGNENMFSEKWIAINPFLKKLQLAKKYKEKKGSRMFVGAKFN